MKTKEGGSHEKEIFGSIGNWIVGRRDGGSCSRFGRVELLISSHPAQAGLFSTRPGENPA